jgi:hypothetical protein
MKHESLDTVKKAESEDVPVDKVQERSQEQREFVVEAHFNLSFPSRLP